MARLRVALGCALLLLVPLLLGAPSRAQTRDRRAGVRLTYLGTAGWEITDGTTVVLVDPYLSRLRRVTPNDTVLPADTRPLFANDSIARSDTATVAAHVRRADYILITHTHYDHVLDAPLIAARTGATIIGTESTFNFARAHGVPADKLLAVRGGEDLELGGLSVRVIPSLHGVLSRTPNRRPDPNAWLPPAVFPSRARPPFKMGDVLIEGGTLAYLVRIGGRQILVFGSMNYVEREVEGLRPDVVLVGAMPERRAIHDYTARLLRAVGYPRVVLPTHWDQFNVPYGASQDGALRRLAPFVAEVRAASPKSRVIVPKHLEPVPVP
jgi:L-ascorbate metabolism protein UlaG (beta-lactamase superfamily)